MRRNWIAGAVAIGALLAGLALLPDLGFAAKSGGHGGRGGGGGHGGGHASGGHASARSSGSGHRSIGRASRGRTSKGVYASRRTVTRNTTHALGTKTSQGVKTTKAAVTTQKSNGAGKHSLKQLTSNKGLRQASFSQHNAFFNNNKFGNGGRNGRDGDNRWRDRSGNWYGYRWAGSVFWPYAFGDYFSYAIWPDEYANSFWGYGPDALLWGTFYPYGEFAGGAYDEAAIPSGDIYNREPAVSAAAPAPAAGGVADLAQSCGGFAPGVSNLPIQSLEKIIDSSEDQRSALQDLKTASANASAILSQSCSSETPLTPVARLDSMLRRLQAMQQADEAVRGPLVRFYGLLSTDQQARLNALSGSGSGSHAKTVSAANANIGALCTSQAEFTDVPTGEIASTVTLTDAQKQQLQDLRVASTTASDALKASCPSSIPNTIADRLDAAQTRVAALIQAVNTIRPAVRDFFASLTDEQKAALNIETETPLKSAKRG